MDSFTAVALAAALQKTELSGGCSQAATKTAVQRASTQQLGQLNGQRVILAGLTAECMCGNVNCPYLVLQLDPHEPRVLLQTYGWAVDPFGAEKPLPRLRERAHDSALITYETIDAYRDGKYVRVESARVRGDTNARKLNNVPIRFAPGTSSARLQGNVSLAWFDDYAFAAQRGQQLAISDVQSKVRPSIVLSWENGTHQTEIKPGVPVVLPRSGTFNLRIENESSPEEAPVPYSLTLSIK
jgi:hypothetical protein